jgi:hypothetical protein
MLPLVLAAGHELLGFRYVQFYYFIINGYRLKTIKIHEDRSCIKDQTWKMRNGALRVECPYLSLPNAYLGALKPTYSLSNSPADESFLLFIRNIFQASLVRFRH